MGTSAGSNQPIKNDAVSRIFYVVVFGPKAINATAWNRNGPQKSSG